MLVEYDLGCGRKVYRTAKPHVPVARSDLPMPMIIGDTFDKPVQSMADGKWYTSKRGLSASAKASGNPHGQDFIELGNEEMKFVPHVPSERQLHDDVVSAIEDVKNGNVPPVLMLND